MKVSVIGAHGKVGSRIIEQLARRGDVAMGLVRQPDQETAIRDLGGTPVGFDLEQDSGEKLAELIKGSDAVVFSAGAGPGSTVERKRAVDYEGAVTLMRAALAAGVSRYILVSAHHVNHPSKWPENMTRFMELKLLSEQVIEDSPLDYTIVRPVRLSDDPGTGKVLVTDEIPGSGIVPRQDVATLIIDALDMENTFRKSFDLMAGQTSIRQALEAI